jgi:AcrR family transcriptional regulator
MPQQRKTAGDRRAEIQRVALSLFTDHGYEATSMRQIAEQLDITKAALYYHFDSKEAIVRSLFEERLATLDSLIEWAESRPHSSERSARIAAAWFSMIVDEGLSIARFAIANQAVMRDLAPTPGDALDRMQKISSLLAKPDASPAERLKIRMALMSVNFAAMGSHGLDLTDAEILAAATETANLIAPELSIPIPARETQNAVISHTRNMAGKPGKPGEPT